MEPDTTGDGWERWRGCMDAKMAAVLRGQEVIQQTLTELRDRQDRALQECQSRESERIETIHQRVDVLEGRVGEVRGQARASAVWISAVVGAALAIVAFIVEKLWSHVTGK